MGLSLDLLRPVLTNSAWLTLIVIGAALLLTNVLPRLLTFGRQRFIAPRAEGPALLSVGGAWVAPMIISLQLAILAGAGLLIVNVIAPEVTTVWPSLLALTVIAAAIVPGNLISEGIAFARIRLLTSYHVDDWVTVVGSQTGQVTTIHLLGTVLRTATGDRVQIGNSRVLAHPIVVHRAPPLAEGSREEATLPLPGWDPNRPPQGPLPRLSKRSLLGATSIQTLVRKRGA